MSSYSNAQFAKASCLDSIKTTQASISGSQIERALIITFYNNISCIMFQFLKCINGFRKCIGLIVTLTVQANFQVICFFYEIN